MRDWNENFAHAFHMAALQKNILNVLSTKSFLFAIMANIKTVKKWEESFPAILTKKSMVIKLLKLKTNV